LKIRGKTAVEQRLIGDSCIACHACCHHLVLKLSHSDLGRDRNAALAAEEYEPAKYRLMPRKREPGLAGWNFYCPFLQPTGYCNIYDTRPDVCRLFKRGSEDCHKQRRLHRHVNQG
jgi:Fe-S-cluster containining protein